MSDSGWLPRHVSSRTAAEVDRFILANLSKCIYGSGDDLLVELMLLCHSDAELAAGTIGPDGRPVAETCMTEAGRIRLRRHLIDTFVSSAPREIFAMFDGRPADPGREAIILGNYVGERLSQYWWVDRRSSIQGGGSFPNDSVTAIAQCVRRVLGNRDLPFEVRRHLVLGLVTHRSPQVSDACGAGLKSIPVDADSVNAVRTRLDRISRKVSQRLLTWILPEVNENGEARRLARELLRSEFGDIRRRSAVALVRDIRREDITPDLVAMAFDDDAAVSEAIRAAIPPETVEQQASIHLLPMLKSGTLSESQANTLAGQIGRDSAITLTFVSLALEIDHGWEDKSSPEKLRNFLSLLDNEQASLPKAMWDILLGCIRRCPRLYTIEQEAAALALAHASDLSAHELILFLLSNGEGYGDLHRVAVKMSASSPMFEERLYGMLKNRHFSYGDMVRLVCAIAELRTDQTSQAMVAKALLKEASGKGELRTAKAILFSLHYVDWGGPIVDAVETIAARGGDLSRDIWQALESRVPGTAEALPRTPAERTRRLAQLHRDWAEDPPPVLAHPPQEIRTRSGHGYLMPYLDFDGGPYWTKHAEPAPLRRSEYPDADRALAWISEYEVDPHPDFWLHMPTDLANVRIERASKNGVISPGREKLIFGFFNGSRLEIGLNDLLRADFELEGFERNALLARAVKGGSNPNPYSEKIGVNAMLAVLRANIGLLCRSAPRDATPKAASFVERPKPTRVPAPKVGPTSKVTDAPLGLSNYHPYRFVHAYRHTAFADAFERNKITVSKQSPAQRVVPALGISPDEERLLEQRLGLMEMLSLDWLATGAHVVDLSSLAPVLAGGQPEGRMLREPPDKGTRYVFLGEAGIACPETSQKIDGFYFKYMDVEPGGFVVIFTLSPDSEGERSDDLCRHARSLSASSRSFLPVGADIKAIGAIVAEQGMSFDASRLAFHCLHLVQNGLARRIGSRDKGYVPVPYGRRHGSENWLEDNAPVWTYFLPDEGEVPQTSALQPRRSLKRSRPSIDVVPERHDGLSTFYLIEERDGVWKRIKKGDYYGRNGDVVFPQFASSRRKILQTTVFLEGKKVAGIVSLDPGYLEFGSSGSLGEAFGRWANERVRWREPEDDGGEDGGRSAWRVESSDIAAVRENLFKGQRATLLVPAYD